MKKTLKIVLSTLTLSLITFSNFVSAHVGYVIEKEDFIKNEGTDFDFLIDAISNNMKDFLLGTVITLAIVGLVLFIRSRNKVKIYMASVVTNLESYKDLLPWMARLALGIALIGAGTAEVFISPVTTGIPHTALLEILLGFLFLLGFMIVPVSAIAVGLFMYGIINDAYLFGNLDFFALAISVFLLGSGKPGLDDILSIDSFKNMERAEIVPLVLRIGLGVSFFYLGMYEKFLNPHDSELVVNTYHLTNVVNVAPALWVLGAGIVECTLGILLFLGFETRLVSIISFIVISLSFFYFKESVYSHVTLFSALSMLVVTGAGKYSIDNYFEKRKLQKNNPA